MPNGFKNDQRIFSLFGKNFVDWEDGPFDKTNRRNHWSVDLKNVFSAIWPLFLCIGVVSLLLVYLWRQG